MKEMIAQIIREEMTRELSKKYYFMAGLPRSGSTMLSAILNQNPRFYSGPSSPVTGIMVQIESLLAQDELYRAFPKREQAGAIIANVIKHYYSDVEKPVIFDKNRSWVNRLHYIPGYFGVDAKVICPVRDTASILASFISMQKRNPYEVNGKINFIDEMLVKTNTPLTDDNRCAFMAGPNGILGQSYGGIKQALMEGKQKQLHFVEYDDLVSNPEKAMRAIYEFLEEEYYEHDFDNLVNIHKEDDATVYGLADMHDIRKNLAKTSIDPSEILSEEILANCANSEFWRNLDEYVETIPVKENFDIQSTESADSNIIGV